MFFLAQGSARFSKTQIDYRNSTILPQRNWASAKLQYTIILQNTNIAWQETPSKRTSSSFDYWLALILARSWLTNVLLAYFDQSLTTTQQHHTSGDPVLSFVSCAWRAVLCFDLVICCSLGFLWGFMLGENPELCSRCCLQALTDPGEGKTWWQESWAWNIPIVKPAVFFYTYQKDFAWTAMSKICRMLLLAII